jgi:hypothetical protein
MRPSAEPETYQGWRNIPERCVCSYATKASDEAPITIWRRAEPNPNCPEHHSEDKGGSGCP